MISRPFQICIVGMGPRGLSVLERLCANERCTPRHSALTVHVVDPAAPGAGAVWRTDQSRHLLMNTVAGQITVYTDDSNRIEGPIEPGPTLYTWAKRAALLGPDSGLDDGFLAEARDLGPDSYPTRAFYGRYLVQAFNDIVDNAPPHIVVQIHRTRAVAVTDTLGRPDGPQSVRLADGTRLNRLDALVLALGHLPAHPAPHEARTAALARIHHLTYLPPGSPADLDLGFIRPGQPVLIRGLGLNYFDHMALLTTGRGGRFERRRDRLVYRPSGLEPKLYATSRRAVPYHARGENEKGVGGRYEPRLVTHEYIKGLRVQAEQGRPADFMTDIWPLIAREIESVYYTALLSARDRAAEREALLRAYLALPYDADPAELLDACEIPESDRWDWRRLQDPCADLYFADRAGFHEWLLEYLRADMREARAGNVSGPLKAALDVLRDMRNEMRLLVDHCGLDGDSHRDHLDRWYTPMNAFLSIGPPVSRIEEMIALIEAGLLELTGPATEIRIDPDAGRFSASSSRVPGPPIHATVLIEARLPEPDLRRTADPLLRHLVETEQADLHRIPTADGGRYETGGLAVTERPYRLLDRRGRAHPRRFAYGVPTESVHWATAAGIRPEVDSVTLGDSDAIARSALALAPTGRPTVEIAEAAGQREPRGVLV
jgi:hypothetical protein